MPLPNRWSDLLASAPGVKTILGWLRLSEPAPRRLTSSEVYPRQRGETHPGTYVTRPELVHALLSGLDDGFHIVIRGQSGNGKSCLYRTVLERQGTYFASCNLADADRLTFNGLFADLLASAEVSATSETARTGNVTVGNSGVSIGRTKKHFDADLFRLILQECRRKAGDRPAVLILDNLEAISQDAEHMKNLANIIMLLDDPKASKHRIALIIVGTTGPFLEYYRGDPIVSSLATRIRELPEVGIFTEKEADQFILGGLVKLLGLQISADIQDEVLGRIRQITGQVPLNLNNYCRNLGTLAQDKGRVVSLDLLREADAKYSGRSWSKPAPPPPSPPIPRRPRFAWWRWVLSLRRTLGWLVAILLCSAALLYVALYLYFRFVF